MCEIRKVLFVVAFTVAVVVWLSAECGSGAEPPHRQPVRDSHVKCSCTTRPEDAEQARHVLNAASELCPLSQESPRLDLLVEMAVTLWRAGDVAKSTEMSDLALKVASNIRDTREHYRALLGIAVGQAEVGRVDAAVGTSELATSPKNRVSVLGQIAETLSVAGDMRNALKVAELIPEEYRERRSAAVSEIASDLAQRGECAQALAVLERIKVDMIHAGKLHSSQRAGASLAPAEEAILGEAVWKAHGLLQVVQCQARAGRFVDAATVAEKIGVGRFRDRAMRNTASIAVTAGNLEEGRRIALQIQGGEERNLALCDIAVGEAAKGLLDDSMKTVAAITRARDKGEAMIRIAVVLAQSGNHAGAKKAFSAAEKEQVDPAARVAAQVTMAQAFAEHGDFTSAQGIAKSFPDQAARARIMAAIGGAYSNTDRSADARTSFQGAYECAMRIAAPYERTQVLREVAASQMVARDHLGAARTLKEAARIATTIPAAGGTNVIALREVAVAQAKSGDPLSARATFDLAMNAAKAYADQEYAARLSQDVMKAQTECGDLETALESANKLERNVIKCRSLLGIAQELLRPRPSP